jgi:SAM-dependent methyltransferase
MADTSPQRLPDDASVVLNPAVEILNVEVNEDSFLCHTELNVGMVVPAGEGLLDFVRSLEGTPARVRALREEYDDQDLIEEMLSSLLGRGFAHVVSERGPVARTALRRAVLIDLDVGAPLEEVCAQWRGGETAPEVLLRCVRLSDHTKMLGELADRRAAGTLRAHHVVARSPDVRCGADLIEFLVRLRASIELDGVEWPAAAGSPPGLADLAQACIDTHVVMAPGVSILDDRVRQRCIGWVRSEHVSGLCLRLDPLAFAEKDFGDVFDAVRALEIVLGDVVVTNLPGDEVLLGNTDRGWLAEDTSDQARRFRLAYLRWRIPLLRMLEGDCLWGQTPEVEEKWVRSEEDLLPNHPELLLLAPGCSVVDVCGGLGRVARRLSRAVGPEGTVISIELRRFLAERARRFAYEGNFTNLQFRPGRAERLPLRDGAVDAAVNEWTGAIWELGLGPTMVKEMARVVRPGGRIAVTHRVVQLQLDALDKPWVQYPRVYEWVREAFRHPQLAIVAQRVWGQIVPSKGGLNKGLWREQYVPRLVNPDDRIFPEESFDGGSLRADVYLTMIAERLGR